MKSQVHCSRMVPQSMACTVVVPVWTIFVPIRACPWVVFVFVVLPYLLCGAICLWTQLDKPATNQRNETFDTSVAAIWKYMNWTPIWRSSFHHRIKPATYAYLDNSFDLPDPLNRRGSRPLWQSKEIMSLQILLVPKQFVFKCLG